MTATKEGFHTSSPIKVELSARQSLRVDITLALASQATTVEVSAAAEHINTENGVLSDTKGTSQIAQLPMNFRASTTSPLQAMTTSAEVEQDSQGNMAVGGATANMVGYSVDGISTANIFLSAAGTNPYPSSEGIAELQVSEFDNSAEFSQVGDVTFTTKSGTNRFHGSLFEYLQNDGLDATVFNFNIKAPKSFNTFGGSLGGPIVLPELYDGHNKTFFFFDYERNRRRTSQPEQFSVPTVAERQGNLNGLSLPTNVLINPATGQPFPNNTIPSSTLNPSALTLLNDYYPLPNVNGNGYNYENLQPVPSSTNGFDGRIDQIINSKQQVYARFNWKNQIANVANPLLPNDVDTEHDRSFLVSHNYAITPTLLNGFRFGFTHTLLSPNFPTEGAAAIAQLGLLDVNVSHHSSDGGFPSINFSNGTGFTPIGRDHVGSTLSSTNQIAGNVTYAKGSHTIRSGVDLRWVRFAVPEIETPSDDYGLFTFAQGMLRRGLSVSLKTSGYGVDTVRNAEEALEYVRERPVDVVLLDINMPGMGGVEACRRIRAVAPPAGIVMLTVRDADADKVLALEAGADDYVTKPFHLQELLARLRAVLRRRGGGGAPQTPVLRFGELELELERRTFRKAGREIHLSPRSLNCWRF